MSIRMRQIPRFFKLLSFPHSVCMIHTSPGSFGGNGFPCTKRSGCCPFYSAGATRRVLGGSGMTWEKEDWVDEDVTSHREPDD